MLDIALEKDLIELLANNFKANQIEEFGRLVLGEFDIYKLLNEQNHITVPSRRAAQLLAEHCNDAGCFPKLIHLLVETDGSHFMGRPTRVDGVELFLEKLTRSGLIYDFQKRRLIRSRKDPFELADWGSLRDGKRYPVTILSVDVVGSSALSRRYGTKRMGTALFRFTQYLKTRLRPYDGRIWNWNGDGGIIAFAFKDHEARAAQFALELQLGMPVLNTMIELPHQTELSLRIALDTGRLAFAADTGAIVSDVINYACHLEKAAAPPGSIAISKTLYDLLPPRIARPFSAIIEFQDREAVLIPRRIDSLRSDTSESGEELELIGTIAVS